MDVTRDVSRFLIPSRIETARLILREFEGGDWHDLHEHYSDIECTRFTFGRALTEGETWRTMASIVGHWVLRGYGPYALEHKRDGVVLGTAGLWYPNDWPEPEIKWALTRRYWGKGYASEAVRGVQEMARKRLPRISLISLIHADNQRSIRLAESVGATLEREMDFRGGRWCVYRHPAVDQPGS